MLSAQPLLVFAIVFAAGRIVGPTLVVSAAALALGSLLATRQRALHAP